MRGMKNQHKKGENMNIRFKKYWVVGFLVLSFGTVQPVTAAPETKIVMTQATNTAIANLEAALKAVTANKLAEAQDYIDATRDSASDILGRCLIEAKKRTRFYCAEKCTSSNQDR